MKKLAAACVLVVACLAAVAGAAGAHPAKPKLKPKPKPRSAPSKTVVSTPVPAGPITFGVADDTGKFADDGGAWFDQELKGASLSEERWTLQFTGSTDSIAQQAFLDRAAPQAQKDGVTVELALYGATTDGSQNPDAFCQWAGYVATTVAKWGITNFIIWNEPNTAVYWRGAGSDPTVPQQYEALLASCYDSIKAANPNATVIGFGLSPRSNNPRTQEAPIPFIEAVGKAYRASGRTKPLMDEMSIHPYPNPNSPTDSPDVGYQNPDFYGIPNIDRVKQAVYDAFNGTAQPTTVDGLKFVIDEVGWQTDTTAYPQYIHDENVKTVSEAQQAQYLKEATEKYFACDPTIATVNWFLLVDEATRDGKDASGNTVGGGWQSGLLTAGGKGVSTPKLAYLQLASDWGQGRAACTGPQITWTPSPTATGLAGKHKGKPKHRPRPKHKTKAKTKH